MYRMVSMSLFANAPAVCVTIVVPVIVTVPVNVGDA